MLEDIIEPFVSILSRTNPREPEQEDAKAAFMAKLPGIYRGNNKVQKIRKFSEASIGSHFKIEVNITE